MIECGEFTCIKTKSMIHIDWGNVEIKEGTKYKCYNLPDEEKYFFSPWEIAAYGMEYGLFKVFCNKLKEERLSK